MSFTKLFELSYTYPKYSIERHVVRSSFFLGVFSTYDKVEKAIDYYSSVTGFSNDPNCFYIRPFCVNNATAVVYQVGISFIAKNEKDDVDEILAYYGEEEEARNAAINSCFYGEFKNDFLIVPITIDKMEWTEGFNCENFT